MTAHAMEDTHQLSIHQTTSITQRSRTCDRFVKKKEEKTKPPHLKVLAATQASKSHYNPNKFDLPEVHHLFSIHQKKQKKE